MNKYNVWVEGYMCTEEHCKAHFLGTIEADNFVDAVRELWNQKFIPVYNGDPHTADDYFSVINKKPYIWGCECFDNETDARRQFG